MTWYEPVAAAWALTFILTLYRAVRKRGGR